MVARLIEGWEQSTVLTDYAPKWTHFSTAIGTAYGRYGNGLRVTSVSTQTVRSLDAQATWIIGAAFRVTALPSATRPIFSVYDGATAQALLGVTTTGTLVVCRNVVGTVLGTTAGVVIAPNVWYYLEWRVTIGNTGSSVVRAGEVEVLNLPSVDTQQTANASATAVYLGPGATGGEAHYDDVYVFDATGSTNTAFVGDCRVERLVPSGAGATAAWTPSAGANYAAVDETPPTADTDYVSSATAGQTDTYAFGNLATTSGTVYAVQATATARKDDAGTRSLALVARPGSTDRVGATQSVGDAYTTFSQVWDANPDTAASWTIAEVNAGEWGQRLIA